MPRLPPRLFAPLLLIACAAEEEPARTGERSGTALFRAYCVMCHGPQGGGVTGLGPDLRGAGRHWDELRLTAYLRDPAGYAKTVEHLGNRSMPALSADVGENETQELVRYVLRLMRD